MWVQHVSEGWRNGPPQDHTGFTDSSLSEPSFLEEGIQENLGHEWSVLHPFEIPGVRFPIDNTPPNQRRLSENDAPSGTYSNHRVLRGYIYVGAERLLVLLPRYGDPFYRERGRGRGRGRGRRKWMSERPFVREAIQGFGRGSFHGNGRGHGGGFYSRAHLERNQRHRHEEEWLSLVSEGR